MKKIISFISFVLVFVSCSNERESKIGEPPPPQGYNIALFQYKNPTVEGKILVYDGSGGSCWFVCGKGEKGSSILEMNDNLYLGNDEYTGDSPERYAVIDRDWGSFSSDKSFYFDDELLEKQIFSRFYLIPRRAVPTLVEKFPISEHYPENIDFINALIDSGDIEQYRVDFGY